MKTKKGYVLATVLVTMAMLLALTLVIYTLVWSSNVQKTIMINGLHNNIIVSNLADKYVNFSQNDYIAYLDAKYEKKVQSNISIYTIDEKITLTLIIDDEINDNIEIEKSGKIVANLERKNGEIIKNVRYNM